MPECTLRAFVPADGEWLREWYRVDQPGMQLVMGTPIPTEAECVAAFKGIFAAVGTGRAQFWMVDCDDEPLGFFVLTDIQPEHRAASVHIFIDPERRQHSLRAAQAGEQMAFTLGFRRLGVITRGRAAHALAKRMGFRPPVAAVLTKNLTGNVEA
jgi:RimJ/RimL family protein N-acetyltransferase